MFDTHIHTKFSTDSSMSIEEVMGRASELGLGVVITDHMDTNYPGKEKFNFDTGSFFAEYEKYRSEKLLLGFELGMTLEFKEENKSLAENNPFDYVIGSIHFLGNNDIFYPVTYEGKSKEEVFTDYFLTMYENINELSYIDSLGHIDYISRYAAYDDKEINYHEYCELIDEVLKVLIKKDIALEINSRRLKDRAAINNMRKIYERYSELGGNLVTIGSDAHSRDAIGANFDSVTDLIKDLKLQPIYFKERKPMGLKIR
jgi:histidinol-phosphatase (PHP family)